MPTTMRTAGRLVLALVVVALWGAMLTPAEAHQGARADVVEAPAPPSLLPDRGRGAFASCVVSGARRADARVAPRRGARRARAGRCAQSPRRALALALVVIVSIFALESGVHSVHHLTDVDRGESCAVASASQHITGTEVDVSVASESLPAARQVAAPGVFVERSRIIGPAQGRAPPALPA